MALVTGAEPTAWDEISAAVAEAPYPVEVLPVEPGLGELRLSALGITTGSCLGAVVAHTGGLLVDHGWLRVLGGGHEQLPEVVPPQTAEAGLTIAYDVLGGQFSWLTPAGGGTPTVHYFGPDDLTWQDLDLGYAAWLHAMLTGALTRFYASLRWPGWEAELAAVAPDQGISAVPPPFTREGKDLATVSRRVVPLAELVTLYPDIARQLDAREP